MGGGGSPLPPPPPVPGTVTQGLLWHTQDSEPPQCHPLLPAQPPFIYTNGSLQWWGGGGGKLGQGAPGCREGVRASPPPRGATTLPESPLSEALDVPSARRRHEPHPDARGDRPAVAEPVSPGQDTTRVGGVLNLLLHPPPILCLLLRGSGWQGGEPPPRPLAGDCPSSRQSPSGAAEGTWGGRDRVGAVR